MSKVKDYRDLRQGLNTFDCLICEQNSMFWRMIGHTAGVVRNRNGQLQVLESTCVNKWTGISGVQLNPMGLWLHHYPGKVYVRQLHMPYDGSMNWKNAHDKSDQFIQMYRGTSYPDPKTREGRWYLIRAAWDSILFKKASTNEMNDDFIFCTDLYMRWLMWCGFCHSVISSEYEPDDMYPSSMIDLVLEQDVYLGEMIRIK